VAIENIFTIPTTSVSGLPTKGSEENPVVIPQISAEHFSYFLEWYEAA